VWQAGARLGSSQWEKRGQNAATPVNNTFKVLQQDAQGEFLPISLLNDFVYCPRRAALKAIEGWRDANEHNKPSVAVHRNNNPLGSFSNFAFRDALIPRRILEPEKKPASRGQIIRFPSGTRSRRGLSGATKARSGAKSATEPTMPFDLCGRTGTMHWHEDVQVYSYHRRR